MRQVTFLLGNIYAKDACETHTVSLLVFVYNVVGVAESAIIPPFEILNERFHSGGECNPFADVCWDPFEIDTEEYDQLIEIAVSTDPSEVWSYKGIKFVKIRRALELDKFSDSQKWREMVCRKYSDEYIAKLTKLNSVGPDDGRNARTSKANANTETPQKPNVDLIRCELIELSSAAIQRFAELHEAQEFYAFGFDLNVTYGEVLLCANTETDFQKTAEKYVKDWNYTDADLEELKRNFGDWRYQGFNLESDDWNERWGPHAKSIRDYMLAVDADEDEVSKVLDNLKEAFTQVLLNMEASGILKSLSQAPDFFIQCIDHDEGEDEAQERLDSCRSASGKS